MLNFCEWLILSLVSQFMYCFLHPTNVILSSLMKKVMIRKWFDFLFMRQNLGPLLHLFSDKERNDKRGMWRRGSDCRTTNTYHIRYVGSQKRFDERDEFIQHCVSVQVVDPLDREWRRFLKYNKSFVYQSWLKSSQYIILWGKVVCIFISIYLCFTDELKTTC